MIRYFRDPSCITELNSSGSMAISEPCGGGISCRLPALLFILVGGAQQASGRGRPIWPALIVAAIVVGVGLIAHNGSQDMAGKLRVRIDALSSAEER